MKWAVVDVNGLSMESSSSRGRAYCLAGPATLVRVWLDSARLTDQPGASLTFSIERLGAHRGGRVDVGDPIVQRIYRTVESGGWRCC